MKRFLRRSLLLASALFCSASFAGEGLQPFTAETLQQVEAQYEGQPFLLVLWSVHCAPCFAELEMLGDMLAQDPQLPLVLVATDAPDMREHVEDVLADYALDAVTTWHFADAIPEKLRYAIDPQWFGELPRSYYYDAAHARSGHSGTLQRAQLEQWFSSR